MPHTPGPWTVDETKALGAYGVWTDYATHPGHDGTGYGSIVCSMLPDDDRMSREARDANARLIAAAPELLALLEESQHFIGGDWRERRDAAIAKSKGTAPCQHNWLAGYCDLCGAVKESK